MKRYTVFDHDIKKIKFDDFIVGEFIEAQYVNDISRPTKSLSIWHTKRNERNFYVREKTTGNNYFILGLENIKKHIIEFELKMFYKLKNKTL